MKNIAFVFSRVPHGTSLSREGLDSVLSISTINQNVSIFFIGDGVFQLMKCQCPEHILSRNYTASFGILPLFKINKFYYCKSSLIERGLSYKRDFLLKVFFINRKCIRKKLNNYDLIINF
ncbi:hypothetical protein XW81_02440 [Buchnera aphidicola (Schlechtendalia chinensis)]|uniref:Uncharacterized protein n=1 Tax=Buchnera aphidicola subsp. Schlechtendalia chinensis TaxID=118110 RepID=A0A172WE62_BUCSC|nr:sulfurtransferase complex subunit TusC [Buchnera aphidicola]ANF17232.1 hypothetical protein XW81_02440 [Buchnera aphidicola (Schlechtendalia chinensis)]